MRLLLTFCLIITLSACNTHSLSSLGQTSTPVMLPSQTNLKQMKLVELDVDITINGAFSKTSMTMTFYNPNKRRLAGDLLFPLPDGALVSGYALDINGVMVDGSIVKKEKARRALETEIRRRVDPGLIEFTKGNNYRTRVFPIPEKGVRIVRVDYVNNLNFNGQANQYHLPLNFKNKLDKFALNIEVINSNAKPRLINSEFDFKKVNDRFIAKTNLKNVTLTNALNIEIPSLQNNMVAVEQALDGQYYFSVMHKGQFIDPTERKNTTKTVSIIWDASGSRKSANHQQELAILNAYLTRISAQRTDGITVYLSLLRNTLSSAKTFTITDGNTTLLMNYLNQIHYDGGTQFGAIDNTLNALNDVNLHLLFSDGLSNFGASFEHKLTAPINIISGDRRSDHHLLRYIAEKTGGHYFNLNKLSNDDVVNAIGQHDYGYQSYSSKNGVITDVLSVDTNAQEKHFIFTGKLKSASSSLTLHFKKPDNTHHSVTLPIDRHKASKGNLLRTVWAQAKINNLLIHDKDNKEAFIELGKTYGLVTPGTSLIVMETLNQYVEHRITPPDSLPEMKANYEKRIAQIGPKQTLNTEERIEQVLNLWNHRIKWWEAEFPGTYSDDIMVSGTRQILQDSIDQRRISTQIVDGLSADEIGDIPALSIGEALETITGASSHRDPNSWVHRGNGARVSRPRNLTNDISNIELKPWSPKTPYLKKLNAATPQTQVATYLQLRKKYHSSISFYLDSANFFYQQKNTAFALRVLSNITELDLDNPSLTRIVAHRLRQMGELELSKQMFNDVIRLRPEEPQSYRDLGFVLAEQKRYAEAIDVLYNVVLTKWDRFDGIELTVLNELNHVIHQAKKAGITEFNIDPRFVKLLDVDIRIVMTWDTDATDIDLHVIEPNGEEAYYGNRLTKIGGLVSRDFTQGYGPEEYLIRKSEPGTYLIKTKYFSNNSNSAIGPVTLQLDIYTNYGRENEKHQSTTIQLKKTKNEIEIGRIKM